MVFDPNGEYRAKGYVETHTLAGLRAAIAANWTRTFRVCYVPQPGYERARLSDVATLLCQVQDPYYKTPDGKRPPIPRILFMVDELDVSFPTAAYDGGFATLCGRSRHYGIDVLGCTPRLSQVSTRFRGTCDIQYFFAQYDATDLKTLAGMVGPAAARRVGTFQPHDYLMRHRGQISFGRNRL